LFGVRVTCARGISLAQARAALELELDRVRTQPPDEAELERVRTQIASAVVRSRQTNNGLALTMVRTVTERGDPSWSTAISHAIWPSTPTTCCASRATYLRAENRTVVEYLPQ